MNCQKRILSVMLAISVFLGQEMNLSAESGEMPLVDPPSTSSGSACEAGEDVSEENSESIETPENSENTESSAGEEQSEQSDYSDTSQQSGNSDDDTSKHIDPNAGEESEKSDVDPENEQGQPLEESSNDTSRPQKQTRDMDTSAYPKGLSMPDYIYLSGAAGTEAVIPLALYGLESHKYGSIQGTIGLPEELDFVELQPEPVAFTDAAFDAHASDGTLRFAWITDLLSWTLDNEDDAVYTPFSIGASGDASGAGVSRDSASSPLLAFSAADTDSPLIIAHLRLRLNRELEEDTVLTIRADRFEAFDVAGNRDDITAEHAFSLLVIGEEILSPCVADLYAGDGGGFIPAEKKAISIAFPTALGSSGARLGEYTLYRNPQRSVGNRTEYVGLVDINTDVKPKDVVFDEINEPDLLFGDANGDGIVDAQDALNILDTWLLTEAKPLDDQTILRMNTTADSRIDTDDVLAVVDYFVNNRSFEIIKMK